MAEENKLRSDKDIVELIEDYEFTLEYPENLPDAYSYDNMWMMLDVRDEIRKLGLDEDPRVVELDKRLIIGLRKFGELVSYRFDNSNKPLEDWWWHLDKIAKKEYPAELLPEPLRKIYLSL